MSKSNKFSPEVRYQSLIDFKPIELASQLPSVIACRPSLGAATLREALAAARKRPRRHHRGHAGPWLAPPRRSGVPACAKPA